MGRACPYEHPRDSPNRCSICDINQHFPNYCTRFDPTRTAPSSSIQNKWKPNSGKQKNPGQDP
eukprot:9121458-Prorocentrum_lima.AAC.1